MIAVFSRHDGEGFNNNPKINRKMKKTVLLCMATLALTGMIFAQSDPVSSIFDKYTGQEGFITISLTGDMLKMAAEMQEYKKDTTFVSELTELKILVHENEEDSDSH